MVRSKIRRAARAILIAAVSVAAGCGDNIGRSPDGDDADADAAPAGLSVRFDDPVSTQEYRRVIPILLVVDSPDAGLRETGIEINGVRKVLCSDIPIVANLHCGGDVGVWESGLTAGPQVLRAFATDEAGHTATAEITVMVRPYIRPTWVFEAELGFEPPVITPDLVLAPADKLYALDRNVGRVRWSYDPDVGGPFDGVQGVVADDSHAYAVTARDREELLLSFDLRTGEIAWQVELPDVVYSRPVFDGDGHIVFANADGDLSAYTRTGALAWQLDVDSRGSRIPAPQPVVGVDGTIYVTPAGYDRIVHVDPAGGLLGRFTTADVYHFALAVADDGRMVSSDDDGLRIYGRDGALARHVATAGLVPGPARFGTGGRIFFAAEHVGAFVLDADGAPVWNVPMPDLLRGTPFEAPNGSIFIGALGPDVTYQYDRDGHRLEEIPYCEEPEGYTADGNLVVCTRHARVYAIDLADFPQPSPDD